MAVPPYVLYALVAASTFLLLSVPDVALSHWSMYDSSTSTWISSGADRRLSEVPELEWTHIDVPVKLSTSFDESCDDRSPKFEVRNKEHVEKQGIEGRMFASRVGVCRFSFYLVKLVLAWITPPELPVKEIWSWSQHDTTQIWTGMAFDYLRDPMLGMMGFSAAEVLVPPQHSEKTSTFLQVKLSQPAKKLGIMMPWNTQCQAAIYIGQVLQGIVEILFASKQNLRFFRSMDFWLLTFRIEIFGPVVYALARSLITAVTINELIGPWRLDYSSYPWNSGVTSLVQRFRKAVLIMLAAAITLLALPFIPSLIIGLVPGILVGLGITACTSLASRCRSRCPVLWRQDEPREEVGLLAAEEGESVRKDAMTAQSSHRLSVVLVAPILTSLVWLPVMSSIMRARFSADTYLCSFSYLAMFELRMDGVAQYILLVVVLTCFIILTYVLLRLVNGQVFKISQIITHQLWITQCLSSPLAAPSQKQELQKALLIMKATTDVEDPCAEAEARRLVGFLSDANDRLVWAAAVLLGRHLQATGPAPLQRCVLEDIGAEEILRELVLKREPEISRAALATLASANVDVPEYRERELHYAKMTAETEQYDVMVQHMLNVVRCGGRLSTEERTLFSDSFFNLVGQKRNSWQKACSVVQRERDSGNSLNAVTSQLKVDQIAQEFTDLTDQVIPVVRQLISRETDAESQMYYLKMMADYRRYEYEVRKDEEVFNGMMELFHQAKSLADKDLKPTHPIRLGIALNMSAAIVDFGQGGKGEESLQQGINMARHAFEEAVAMLDDEDEYYRDSTLIMQVLRDNVTTWTSVYEDVQPDADDFQDNEGDRL